MLAGTCVFGKQSLEVFRCDLRDISKNDISNRQGLFQSYARCIAEFLNEGSLVHLRILSSPTCVGLRYGYSFLSPRGFSWSPFQKNRFHPKVSPFHSFRKYMDLRICLKPFATLPQTFIPIKRFFSKTTSPQSEKKNSGGILTSLSIGYPFRVYLRADSPWVDGRCPGNLRFTVEGIFTPLSATHANILTSLRSIAPHRYDFSAQGTLSYHPI